MRIEITKPGIYGANGEIPVGTELTVKSEPTGWAGRYRVINEGGKGKTAVTNPKKPAGMNAVHKGGGSYSIVDGDKEVATGLTKDDAERFNSASDEDKAAFVESRKAAA